MSDKLKTSNVVAPCAGRKIIKLYEETVHLDLIEFLIQTVWCKCL